jgi:predicted DNA binding protein
MYKTGLREMETDPGVVPVEVAALGQAYVAAYLYSVHNYDLSEIAEKLDVTEQSISQYVTDVGNLRR